MAHSSPLALPKSAAGKLMTTNVPIIKVGATVKDVKDLLLKESKKYETISYIYVVNTKGKFVGVCSIRQLFSHVETAKIANVMVKNPFAVRVHTDRKRVAYESLKRNIKTMPIIDKHGVFLGVVDSDDILKILYEEMQEDLFHAAGVRKHNITGSLLDVSLWQSFKSRLPWLLIGLVGGFLAAFIVKFFEETIAQYLILAAFIPLVVYMADAAKIQMQIFIIRDLAKNPDLKFGKYFIKQLAITFLLALIIGLIFGGISGILYQQLSLSLVLGIGLFCAILSSVFSGLIVPYLFAKLKLDPANGSGPIATIIQDVSSIIIYFLVVSWLL